MLGDAAILVRSRRHLSQPKSLLKTSLPEGRLCFRKTLFGNLLISRLHVGLRRGEPVIKSGKLTTPPDALIANGRPDEKTSVGARD